MADDSKKEKLFAEFPPVSTEQWEAEVNKDLKGADYAKRLVWETPDGFPVKPYYRREDTENLKYLSVYPDAFPYVRGNHPKGNNWRIRQDIKVDDVEAANKKALDILMKGVDSLGFVFSREYQPETTEIERLLDKIYSEAVELNFINGDSHKIIAIVEELALTYNRNLENIFGSVDFDPIGYLVNHGKFCITEEKAFGSAVSMINATEHLPNFDAITVHGDMFKNAGATITQELAFSMASGAEYLTRLTELGLSIDDIAPKIRMNMATGPQYFPEIAKHRAARILWAHIVNAYGPNDANHTKLTLHGANATWNKTLYDAYVNMVRTTTESMAASLGGINSFTVMPFDLPFGKITPFSERIARNQQLLLKEEAWLDKVADPAAGAYYIENLTDQLVQQAWNLFLEIDDSGGFVKAFQKGMIQALIKKSANDRNMAIATRKETLLGTNQYPNFSEHIEDTLDSDLLEPQYEGLDDADYEPLSTYRGAQPFERLRYTTDLYAKTHPRPKVFMLTYGDPAMRRARSQFAANFFACAGFEIIDNNGFNSVESGIDAATKAQADIIVLCSSDDAYLEMAQKAATQLKYRAILVIAGYPKDQVDALKKYGISHFIHLKSNVLESLKQFQSELKIS